MRKKWIIRTDDAVQVRRLAEAAGIDELTAKILLHRDITTASAAEKFLNPTVAQEFYNPFEMSGMQDAVDRIIVALEGEEKICVYGDYDVDGMSGTALLTRMLRELGGEVSAYIPNRNEGYGMNLPALEKIIAGGVTLLISVDCGISNAKEISAVSESLDVIVTDHHLPALEEITDAVAVLDPNQPDCDYPEKNLCGAGVAFKICQALAQEMHGVNFANHTGFIELAALATVADLVPLTGENRKIVKLGLEKVRETKCKGLAALIKVAGLEGKKISASNVAFQIAPRLNSIGRLESASTGLKLLLIDDEFEAEKIAERMEEMNKERKRLERKIFAQAEEKVQKLRDEQGGDLWTLTVFDKGWNAGIIGLTASKLAEKHTLPAVVISEGERISRGSCRSIPALHMKNALDSMAELFDNYGGHRQAAGFSLPTKNIPEFKRRFDEYVKANLTDEDYPPVVKIDALIHPTEIDFKTAEEFEKLEPFGLGNPEPILACRNVHCNSSKIIGSDKTHLSFVILAESEEFENVKAVAFSAAKFASVVEHEPIDIVYQIGLDEWNGAISRKCFVSEIVPAAESEIVLTREFLTDVYKSLKIYRSKTKEFELYGFSAAFNEAAGERFSVNTIMNAVNIFKELGLFSVNEETRIFNLPANGKRALENSRTFRLHGK